MIQNASMMEADEYSNSTPVDEDLEIDSTLSSYTEDELFLEDSLRNLTNGTVGWPPYPSQVTMWLVEVRDDPSLPCPNGFVCQPLETGTSLFGSETAEQNSSGWDNERTYYMSNCTKIRLVALAYGFGDVHAGAFCPDGEDRLLNCPVGHYCPTADQLLACPEGFFCPHKTARPEIQCQGCGLAEESLLREAYGWIIIFLILLSGSVYSALSVFFNSRKDLYSKIVELSNQSMDGAKSILHRRQRRKQINRLKPKLFAIQQRLREHVEQKVEDGPDDTTDCSDLATTLISYESNAPSRQRDEAHQNQNGARSLDSSTHSAVTGDALFTTMDNEKIVYHPDRLFDALDTNRDGVLDYDELQPILELNELQLAQFVARMNQLADGASLSKTVSRSCFFRYFLRVLEEATFFGPTKSEVIDLFEELQGLGPSTEKVQGINSTRSVGEIPPTREPQLSSQPARYLTRRLQSAVGLSAGITKEDIALYEHFYESSLSNFLSDPQINHLIALFRQLSEEDTGEGEESENGHSEPSLQEPPALAPAVAPVHRRSFLWKVEPGVGTTSSAFQSVKRSAAFFLPTGVFASSPVKKCVTRRIFVKYYAQVLAEITAGDPKKIGRKKNPSINRGRQETDERGIDLQFENLALTVKVGDRRVNVVNNVSGHLKAMTMTALMGGSGAGKTSLLNALCGRAFYGETSGVIRINGNEASIEEHKDATGFVPQDDIVHAELTVKENLLYSGRFTLPKGTSMEEIDELADIVLANLGLSRVANSVVGDVNRRGVSGGEKKRVNIGIELMSRPRILFLDEPTSGLDSSSALLVMESLKNLVQTQGVTILSVIHQPRKAIFDSFDSLILLGVGGNMVYHGPPNEAESYFASIPCPYFLPQGESVADWLIDVSSGRLPPDRTIDRNQSSRSYSMDVDEDAGGGDAFESRAFGAKGPSHSNFEHSLEKAKRRRQNLYQEWIDYDDLAKQLRAERGLSREYALPAPVEKPGFMTQLQYQIQRNILISWRNRASKIADTTIVVGAVVLVSWLEGVAEVTRDSPPRVEFEDLVEGSPLEIPKIFPQLFIYALGPTQSLIEFGLKVGVITSVLLSLTAAKAFTSKRLEFFRESGSGWDINAYFLALNITSTLEHVVQMIIAAWCAYWFRDSLSSWYAYQVTFLMLMWLVVSWSLFIPMLVPANNTVLAVGFFMAFFGLLFSGGIDPVKYNGGIYADGSVMAIFSGFFSVTRFFIEGLTVQEQKCLPQQSGFTIESTSVNFPLDQVGSFNLVGLAQNDESVVQKSCSGWYWGVLPALMVGFTIRFLAAGVLHISDRPKQAKKPLWDDLWAKPYSRNKPLRTVIVFVCCWLGLASLSAWLLIVEVGNTGIEERPSDTNSTAELAALALSNSFAPQNG